MSIPTNGLSFSQQILNLGRSGQSELSSFVDSVLRGSGLPPEMFGFTTAGAGSGLALGAGTAPYVPGSYLPLPFLTGSYGGSGLSGNQASFGLGALFDGSFGDLFSAAMYSSPALGQFATSSQAGYANPLLPDANAFGGAMSYFSSLAGIQSAVANMGAEVSSQVLMSAGTLSAQQAALTSTQVQQLIQPGRAASLASLGGSSFVDSLPASKGNKIAELNISGKSDVKAMQQALDILKTASPKLSAAEPGAKGGAGSLVLSAADVDAIRRAPSLDAAKEVVRQAIIKQTGKDFDAINPRDRNAIRKGDAREALNALLGTKCKNGKEKNSGSAVVMDALLESVANSVRGSDFGSTLLQQQQVQAVLGQQTTALMFSQGSGVTYMSETTPPSSIVTGVDQVNVEIDNDASAIRINLDEFAEAERKVAELHSPLIFDLEGLGLKIQGGGFIEVDLDGDGKVERIKDLDAHLGLLVFDSRFEAEPGETRAAGRDMFGNGTDLTAYGIEGPKEDKTFENGFDALRALCEHLGLVKGKKQHLDRRDLAFLERECSLRMRVGGVVDGADRRFADIGITRINLGVPDKIFSLAESPEDAWGNKLMLQQGATFIVKGQERPYADLWFDIKGRAEEEDRPAPPPPVAFWSAASKRA